MKLLLDMNLSPRFVAMLAAEGFEAARWSAVGPAPADEIDRVADARTQDIVVLTHDLDFSALFGRHERRDAKRCADQGSRHDAGVLYWAGCRRPSPVL